MLANRGRDTSTEIAVRQRIHRRGLRYLVDARAEKTLRRRADIVFRGPRVAVFIDGCFWHGCPDHYSAPVANEDFWARKIAANRARDRDTTEKLVNAGWKVLRFWEHEDPDVIADQIEAAVRGPAVPPATQDAIDQKRTVADP